jgi:hypothetical protein
VAETAGTAARPDSAAPVASSAAPSAQNLAVLGAAAKANGGSELFDALLMAAAGGKFLTNAPSSFPLHIRTHARPSMLLIW